jgi:hypothetical protein
MMRHLDGGGRGRVESCGAESPASRLPRLQLDLVGTAQPPQATEVVHKVDAHRCLSGFPLLQRRHRRANALCTRLGISAMISAGIGRSSSPMLWFEDLIPQLGHRGDAPVLRASSICRYKCTIFKATFNVSGRPQDTRSQDSHIISGPMVFGVSGL